MPQTAIGKRAYKLYNKVGATEKEKRLAIKLINSADVETLDDYGQFTRAEIIFWTQQASPYTHTDAFQIFQKLILGKQTPTPLLVGSCFFVGRCYELGIGTDYNMSMAYAHYRLANKINPKACVKDIARLQKILNCEPQKTNTATPVKFRYDKAFDPSDEFEYHYLLEEWAKEFDECKESYKKNGFFYADDPDEVEADLYNVPVPPRKQ